MADCQEYGWGEGPWGSAPWGGGGISIAGGPLPKAEPFDIFCVGECGEIGALDSFEEVEEVYAPGQVGVTPEEDYRISSGGAYSSDPARIFMDTSVPATWTIEYTAKFEDLPADFSSLQQRHLFVGVGSVNQYSAGLFFSEQGVMYTGSVLFDQNNQLVLNHPISLLPNSLNWVQPGKYYTVRIALEQATQTVYLYITEAVEVATGGHQLRAILAALPASSAIQSPVTGTVVSVRGTPADGASIHLRRICLGTGLLIANLPPVADAGRDMSARKCAIVRLNGEGSYDPEGTPLTFSWKLVDAPETSRAVLVGYDGGTPVSPSPLTNLLYSDELGQQHAVDAIAAGDVLSAFGGSYDIVLVGVDADGFYVQVSEFSLPSGKQYTPFKVIRQRGLAGRDTARPTYYLDALGVFRFSLMVSDGQFFSLPVDTITNVVESEVPRGVIPDMSFLWNYISNFWRMVEGTEPFEVFWSALAQITASELMALWQHDYSKGLRDVPKTMQRRWLHYDLLLKEPFKERTTAAFISGGVYSATIPSAGLDLGGLTVEVESLTLGPRRVFFQGNALSPDTIRSQLQNQLGPAFVVTLIPVGADFRIAVTSVDPFTFSVSSSAPIFDYPAINTLPSGDGGVAVTPLVYRVERSLQGVEVREGDYLVVADAAYRIVRAFSDASDPASFQRILLSSEIPLNARPDWSIARACTSAFFDFYNALVTAGDTAFFEVTDLRNGAMTRLPARVLSAPQYRENGELLIDTTVVLPYLRASNLFTVYFDSVYRRTHVPVDPLVFEIPYLQEKIKSPDDSEVLRQNIDFFIDKYRERPCIRFVTGDSPDVDVWQHDLPAERMWAEVTYLDNNPTIESQYGLAVDFTLDDLSLLPTNSDYLSVVRGLWYSYLNGPTVNNLRTGSQILLGLPFAEETGIISEIDTFYSPTQARLLVTDVNPPNQVRAYFFPRTLNLEVNPETKELYAVGDSVQQFAALVKGVDVLDYVNDPTWFVPYLGQQGFYEVDKFFHFLVRVDSEAFGLQTLLFVKQFILRVKPTYTYPRFVVQRKVEDATVEVTDLTQAAGKLTLLDGVCGFNRGMSFRFDDYSPGGGYMTQWDSGAPYNQDPLVYPDPHPIVYWGYDKEILCPLDSISGTACMTYPTPAPAVMDAIFTYDMGVFTSTLFADMTTGIHHFPATPGIEVGVPVTAGGAYSLESIAMDFDEPYPMGSPSALTVHLHLNGSIVRSINITVPSQPNYTTMLPVSPTLPVASGDVVRFSVSAQGATAVPANWATVHLRTGAVYFWSYDTDVPAGTYCTTEVL